MGPLPPTPTSTAPKSKLRDSCHNCATSKLKCSKDKPTCARCERRGKKCEYYATKRAGRKQPKPNPTANSNNTSKDAPAQATIEPHVGLVASESDTVHLLWGMDLLPSPDASSNASSGSTLGNFMVPFDFDDILGTPTSSDMIDTQRSLALPGGEADANGGAGTDGDDTMDGSAGAHSLPADDLSFLSSDFLSIDNMADQNGVSNKMDINLDGNSLMSGSLVNSPFALTSSGVHDRGYSLAGDPECNCLIRALDLLRRLGTDSPNCTHAFSGSGKLDHMAREVLHSTTRQPTIDRLITENRATIETTSKMLECTCSQDGYLLSIMTFIALKVLGTYAIAMRGGTTLESDDGEDFDADGKDDDCNTTNINSNYYGNRNAQSHSYSEHLVRSSMIAPSYCFDVEEQGRMVAQQIMGELHLVQRLVNSLSQRLRSDAEHVSSRGTGTSHSTTGLSEGKASGSPIGGIPVPLSATLMGQLETDLRKHLRAVSGQILNVLRQS